MEIINGDLLSSEVNTGSPIVNGIVASRFVFDIQTVGIDDTFTLPLESIGIYDFVVSWGDGNSDTIAAYDDAAVTHTYATGGTHTIGVRGKIEGWRFNNGGDKEKIYDISRWGQLNLGNSIRYYYGCTNLSVGATDTLDLTGTTTLLDAFKGCSGLTSLDVSNWDISSVITLSGVLCTCPNLTSLDVSNWDISSVVALWGAFCGCSGLTSLDVSNWNTPNVTDLRAAFYGCSGLTSLDVSNWDITSLTTAAEMLFGVTLITASYDSLLTSWEAQEEQSNVVFHGGNSKYSAGAPTTARAALVANGWTITDGGQV